MRLRNYIIRRCILLIPTLIGVAILIFVVLQFFTPMERAGVYMTSPQHALDVHEIIRKYHLDAPIHIQFVFWLRELLNGNLGYSTTANMPVTDAIITFLPATLELTLFSVPLIVILGIRLGVQAAINQNKFTDYVTRITSIIGWSLPSFWLGILLLAIFYGQLGVLAPERLGIQANIYVNSVYFARYTRINTIDALLNGELWVFVDALKHLILPVLSLTVQMVAMIIRLMRSSMLETLNKGFIMTARAKGLDQKDVIYKHAKKNALIPVITVTGMLLAGLITGAVITETVFEFKGIGFWAANAAMTLDIPAVLGFALFVGLIFVFTNLVVDILYVYIDPRIRLE